MAIKSGISEVTEKAPLTIPRVDIGLCALKIESEIPHDMIFAFGGNSQNESGILKSVSKVDQFSVKENSWKSLPDLVTARSNSSGCIISNSLYVFGGYSSETGSL